MNENTTKTSPTLRNGQNFSEAALQRPIPLPQTSPLSTSIPAQSKDYLPLVS